MEEMQKAKAFVMSLIERKMVLFSGYADSIWSHPELGCSERQSSRLLVDVLRENGFEVEEGMAGMSTAFVARWGTGDPAIGFSCEYDALPGIGVPEAEPGAVESDASQTEVGPGHGCGHNLLGVGNVLAAVAAKEWLGSTSRPGRVIVFGTPAEEICIGKPFMAREGVFEEPDAILDWHPWFHNSANYDTCNAYFNVKYHFRGRTAHGNAPWMGRSALDSAVLMAHAIELLREHIPPGSEDAPTTVNYTFSDVGPSYPNVVPDRSTLWVIGRMSDSKAMAEVMERVDRCAEGASVATGTTWEKEFKTATHEKIPNKVLSEVLHGNFVEIGAPEFTPDDEAFALRLQEDAGAEQTGLLKDILPFQEGASVVTDNSEYSWFAPFAMIWVTLAPPGLGWHNRYVAESAGAPAGKKVLATAAKVLACSCVELFIKPEVIDQAKQELKTRLAGKTYQTLIPEGVSAPEEAGS